MITIEEAKPNKAHLVLAENGASCAAWQDKSHRTSITSTRKQARRKSMNSMVIQSGLFVLGCRRSYAAADISLEHIPPTCRECGGLLKPDFVFLRRSIPQEALGASTKLQACQTLFLSSDHGGCDAGKPDPLYG